MWIVFIFLQMSIILSMCLDYKCFVFLLFKICLLRALFCQLGLLFYLCAESVLFREFRISLLFKQPFKLGFSKRPSSRPRYLLYLIMFNRTINPYSFFWYFLCVLIYLHFGFVCRGNIQQIVSL